MIRWTVGLILVSLCGCGIPLYPKTTVEMNPATGKMAYSTQSETAVKLGKLEARQNPDGSKSLTLGTDEQPALDYGTQSQGIMEKYALQQEKYNQILDTIGKNLVPQLEAVGNLAGQVLGGIAGIRSAGASVGGVVGNAICTSCDNVGAQVQDALNKIAAAKKLAQQLQEMQQAVQAADTK